jgi:hypothetical protein
MTFREKLIVTVVDELLIAGVIRLRKAVTSY